MRATAKNIQRYLDPEYFWIKCIDGFSVKLDGSQLHWCKPKEDYATTYIEVEMRYPSQVYIPARLFAENKKDLTKTVYRNVPLQIVLDMLNEHGGINTTDTRRGEFKHEYSVS